MAYVAPIHQPSSIRNAVALNFCAPGEESLVVAKANRLEIYATTSEGLSLQHSKTVYGKITFLKRLRYPQGYTDRLLVGTELYMYFTLSWDPATSQIKTDQSYVDQGDRSSRDTQTQERCNIDVNGRFMTLEIFEGIVTLLPISQKLPKSSSDPPPGSLLDPIPIRIEEMFVLDSTFIDTRIKEKKEKKYEPKIAFLFHDARGNVKLKVRSVDYTAGLGAGDSGNAELHGTSAMLTQLDPGSSHLIPVNEPTCGLLILGESSITYYEFSSYERTSRPLDRPNIWVSWEQIDRQRYLLASEYGNLYLLMLHLSETNQLKGWTIELLGETSRAAVLTYLGSGLVFLGSHQGNSQVLKIHPKSIEVVQILPNIAPIIDFTIMDMGSRNTENQSNEFSSGQARLITGSGAYQNGSLRSVRSGVGLEDLGVLGEFDNILDLFSIKTKSSSTFADLLLVAFVDETRVFQFFEDGELAEVNDPKGIILTEGTFLAANVSNDKILQVTKSSIRLADSESGMLISEWAPSSGETITAAAANGFRLIAAINGTVLLVLDVGNDLKELTRKTFDAENQIACVTVSPSNLPFCVVGFWQSSSISILNIDTLAIVSSINIISEGIAVPRSMLLLPILSQSTPTLFISVTDGNVISYDFDPDTGALKSKQTTLLGTQQANLKPLARSDLPGVYSVFATCEHPSLIYASGPNDGGGPRLVYSAITASDATCVSPFSCAAYPGAIAIASRTDLKLAMIDEERSTHVQGLHIGETVRRIAYSPELKAFGLGTVKRVLEHNAEIVTSQFRLVDEVLFQVLDNWPLNEDELVESTMRCPLSDGMGGVAERFVVGTTNLSADDEAIGDAIRGRILVFEVTEDRKLKIVAETATKGACRCVVPLLMPGESPRIVAALVKTVVVYDFEYEHASSPYLVKRASYRSSTAPVDIAVNGAQIAVTDIMKSLSVLEFKPSYSAGGGTDKLVEIGRHYQTVWGTAVATVDKDTWLQADSEGNLTVLRRDTEKTVASDGKKLSITSEMNLGEMVNRIRPIPGGIAAASTSTDVVVIPKAFIATVDGSIQLYAHITPKYTDLLIRLQSSLANHIISPGHVPFNKYRAFKNQMREMEEPMRFVDGELLERFMDAPPEIRKSVIDDMGIDDQGWDATAIDGILESLRRLR